MRLTLTGTGVHVGSFYVRLVGARERPRFSERERIVRRIPLARGARLLIRKTR